MRNDISIVIVNYNVRHFLQQTLESVERAKADLKVETWVVDNNSVDDSVAMVKELFPKVQLIENKDNPGFSIANNQAISKSNAKYILLLNPDTVLQEDTLKVCFSFMESNAGCGAVGAKMIDGSGNFLPESKRGFPTPWVSFCKATGLSKLFPKSSRFNQYHLGFLDENKTHEIDVLCGAFMFMRSEVLDEVGLLDETFFMYGEDIDLSYRIKKANHKIYYLPDTQLIHFKGESTKKTSVNYVRVFYQAMIIFVKKHYSGKGAGLLLILLNVAIVGRATISVVKRFFQRFVAQVIDLILLYGGLVVIKELWERLYFENAQYFAYSVYLYLGIVSIVYVLGMYVAGVYRSYYKVGQLVRSIFTSLLVLLAVYALLPLEIRFSRALIIFSGFWAVFIMVLIRLIRSYVRNKDFRIGKEKLKRIFIFGSKPEIKRVEEVLKSTLMEYEIVGRISSEETYETGFYDGGFSKALQLATLEKANEFVFCMKDLEWKRVMKLMKEATKEIEFKMVGDEHLSILGSKSKNTSGELYSVDFVYNLNKAPERIKKRVLDVALSLIGFLVSPLLVLLLLVKGKRVSNFFNQLWQVLIGRKTLVSYKYPDEEVDELPRLKSGIIELGPSNITGQSLIHRANVIYAKEYTIWRDIELIFTKAIT